jgi:hypothetical protein
VAAEEAALPLKMSTSFRPRRLVVWLLFFLVFLVLIYVIAYVTSAGWHDAQNVRRR